MNEKLKKQIKELIKNSVIYLPEDVKTALQKAHDNESNELAKLQLKNILDNIETAEQKKIPLCQDTGVPIFFVKIGEDAELPKNFEGVLKDAVVEAVKEVPLRPNIVDPIERKNTGTNTELSFPWVNYEFVPGKEIEVTVFPKGGGSENMSALGMLNPSDGLEGIKKFVFEKVKKFGGNACPPYILGIGLGGSSDICMHLAKKATLREINSRNSNPKIAKLEDELLEKINQTGIGTMGLGGDTTALDVHIEMAGEHVAVNSVGLNLLCWAARKGVMKI